MYTVKEMFLTPSKYTRPNIKIDKIKGIVIHWVGNPKTTAVQNRNYLNSLKRGIKSYNGNFIYASAHEIIDLNGDIITCIPDDEMAYHAGSNSYTEKYWEKYRMSPNKCMYGIECTHLDWNGNMSNSTYNSLVDRCVDLCIKWKLDPLTDVWTHKEVVGWKDCHLWFVRNPSEWDLFRNKIKDKMNKKLEISIPLVESSKYPQWQINCVEYLRTNRYITAQHLPDEVVNFGFLGIFMNNKWSQLYGFDPIKYLMDNKYINDYHDYNQLLTMDLWGYIVSHRMGETIQGSPIDYLLNKGIIQYRWEGSAVVNMWMLGAMIRNATAKGINI